MTWEGVKKTLTAVSPIAMVADSKILAQAPKTLTASGVGDLLGKYIALFDWKLSNLLTDEYYCLEIVKMEEQALQAVIENIERLSNASPTATETLMYGLVLSGLAMQMALNSRPASGAEHHISHCIEMQVLNDENAALHGEKVGVATAIVSDIYHEMASLSVEQLHFFFENQVSDEELKEVFSSLYEQITEENKTFTLPDNFPTKLSAHWEEICALIAKLPTGDEIRRLLTICGGSTTLNDLYLDEKLNTKLLRYAPFVRNRLTLLRLKNHFRI